MQRIMGTVLTELRPKATTGNVARGCRSQDIPDAQRLPASASPHQYLYELEILSMNLSERFHDTYDYSIGLQSLQVTQEYLDKFETIGHHHHHISVMELDHLLARSGLTYPEVSSKVCHDSVCQLGNSVSLPWVKTAGYIWTDYKTNAQNAKELKITPILDKLLEYKRNWIQHVNRMKQLVNVLTLRRLMSYIYGAPILDVSRSHTTTQHSR